MNGVLVLNACGTVLGPVSWQRAITLLTLRDEKGDKIYEIEEADPEKTVHSPSLVLPFPRVIRRLRWLYVKFTGKAKADGGMCTKRGVLTRDKHTCGYCGKPGDTVDHVLPASRGGKLTWENLITACKSCNGKKADRTPDEAGMKLKWHPWRPDLAGAQQRKVWAALA